MAAPLSELRSTAGATADVLSAVVALAILVYPAAHLGNALLGSPVPAGTLRLLVGVLALGGAYPFVAGDWSLDALVDAFLAFVAAVVVAGVLGGVVIAALDLGISGGNPTPQAVAVGAAYVVAGLFVRRRGAGGSRRAGSS